MRDLNSICYLWIISGDTNKLSYKTLANYSFRKIEIRCNRILHQVAIALNGWD